MHKICKARHVVTTSIVKTVATIIDHRLSYSVYKCEEVLFHKSMKFSPSFWNDVNNHKKYMDWVGEQLKIQNMSDWYNVSTKALADIGAGVLLKRYQNSPSLLLSKVYPDYNWLLWKFGNTKIGEKEVGSEKEYMDWVGTKLNISKNEDWYKITIKELNQSGCAHLLLKYGTPMSLFSSVYSDFEWLPWKFVSCPTSYWDNIENQRKYLEWVKEQLNVKEMRDWYKLQKRELLALGGARLLDRYNDSPFRLLSNIYPEYDWLPWLFVHCPRNFWKDRINVVRFLEWAAVRLGVQQHEDWYRVSITDIVDLGGSNSINLEQLLPFAYPSINWEFNNKLKSSYYRKSQHILKTMLNSMFPNKEYREEYHHPSLLSDSKYPLQLDIYYPQLNLAFEYQGKQHYKYVRIFHGSNEDLKDSKRRDIIKKDLCKYNGITLIEIPYWWDRSFESLEATVYSYRPDLFQTSSLGKPIPLTEPSILNKNSERSGPTIMTSTLWEDSKHPEGWWMSEKYDGMRLYWDGTQFYSRSGKLVEAPLFIVQQMPNIPLDGEIWTRYGLYQEAVGLTKTMEEDRWRKAIYYVFDAPGIPNESFEDRVKYLENLKNKGTLPSFVNIVDMIKCTGRDHLHKYYEEVISKGGEGVMLREPKSFYRGGRSESLKKYKSYFDVEVKVIENKYPHGLVCELTNGKTVFVGIVDNFEAAKRLKEGATVTVKHLGTNVYGTLQYPKFYRERIDVTWQDLIKT